MAGFKWLFGRFARLGLAWFRWVHGLAVVVMLGLSCRVVWGQGRGGGLRASQWVLLLVNSTL